MLNFKTLGFCVCILTVLAPPVVRAGNPEVSTFEKRFPLKPGQPASVSFRDSDGDVKFLPGEGSEVLLKVWKETKIGDEAKARSLMDEIKVETSQQGNDVQVEIRYPKHWGFFINGPEVRVRSEVVVPRECRLECRTSDGDISVADIKGSLYLGTSDGDILASGTEGRIEARTSDGEVELDDVRGDVKAKTSDGNIRLKGVVTVLDLETSDGDITVEALPESRAAGDWYLRASDGDIRLALAPDFSAEVRIHTGDGDINTSLPLILQGKTSEHDLQGVLGSGGRLVDLKSSDGDITLKSLSDSKRRP
jgi:hypothetical protein